MNIIWLFFWNNFLGYWVFMNFPSFLRSIFSTIYFRKRSFEVPSGYYRRYHFLHVFHKLYNNPVAHGTIHLKQLSKIISYFIRIWFQYNRKENITLLFNRDVLAALLNIQSSYIYGLLPTKLWSQVKTFNVNLKKFVYK